jgi:outer membrane lipoprotein-sorting protein
MNINFAKLILLFAFLIPTYTWAQDKKAEAILKSVAAKYKSFKTYKANFKYNLVNKRDGLNVNKAGTLYVKSSKFRLEISGQDIICDNKTIWTYNHDANEVQISNYDQSSTEVNPSKIFSMYEKGFISQFVEELKESGKVLQLIELTPTEKKKSYFKVKLYIDKLTNQIVRTKIFERNNNIITYDVVKFQAHIKIKDTFFSFNKADHPGVEVIDLR